MSMLLTAALLWLAAFAIYLHRMEAPAFDPTHRTDALIVLTGSSHRIERGMELLAERSAPVLFISGVGKNVTVSDMLTHNATPDIKRKILENHGEIVLDYEASATQSNASESAKFIRARHYKSIRLITANYHMPRSLVEFHAVLPDVTIYTEPVLSDQFRTSIWWKNPATRSVVIGEFHKFLAAKLRTLIQSKE